MLSTASSLSTSASHAYLVKVTDPFFLTLRSGSIKRISHCVPPATLHSIYHGLVQSHFDYCSVVWGNCAKTLSDKLQRLQNRAVRVLTNTCYDADANQLLKELGWDNLETKG